MEKRIVYADNAATTPLSKASFEAMQPYFFEEFGNPSAHHFLGYKSKTALESSRKKIASSIGALSNEIYFTSGGTESNNWALTGALEKNAAKGNHIITSSIEHSSIFNMTELLKQRGYEITYLPVDALGQVDTAELENAITEKTILVSIMLANNEIGTILNIKELCDIAHKHKILFHTDAVQAVGHIPIKVKKLGVDMLSMSSHKFEGPKGVGALYLKVGTPFSPLIVGGGQEKNMRSGTSNTPGIVGMAAALVEATKNLESNILSITSLRDRLIEGVLKNEGVSLTGDPNNRLPGIASFVCKGINGTLLVNALSESGVCASAGSACSAGSGEQSRILVATGHKELSSNAVRFSLSSLNSLEDIEYIIEVFPSAMTMAIAKMKAIEVQTR